MVTHLRAGLPEQPRLFQAVDHLLPIVERRVGHFHAGRGQAGGVGQQVAHQHAVFAMPGEFGPVFYDRRIEIEQAALRQHVHGKRQPALGGRPQVDERIRGPGAGIRGLRRSGLRDSGVLHPRGGL